MRLIVRDLQKSYGKNVVFRNIGYSFDEGVIYGIVAKQGSGKTTLFDCISGEVKFSGSIELEDDRKDILLPGLDNVSVSFQNPMIPEFLTGFEYIRYFLDVHKGEVKDTYSVEEYMQLVGIPMGMWGELIKNYSVDYKNRLQLIGLFIMESPITLIDEPCHDMPRANWEHIRALLNAFKKDRVVILATETEAVAKALCDEIIYLENGHFSQVRTIIHEENAGVQMTIDDLYPETEAEFENDMAEEETAYEEDSAYEEDPVYEENSAEDDGARKEVIMDEPVAPKADSTEKKEARQKTEPSSDSIIDENDGYSYESTMIDNVIKEEKPVKSDRHHKADKNSKKAEETSGDIEVSIEDVTEDD